MAKIVSITEHFQHFLADLKESFWGDLEQKTRFAFKRLREEESERLRDRYAVRDSYERGRRRELQFIAMKSVAIVDEQMEERDHGYNAE
jgi:hypothetical protein